MDDVDSSNVPESTDTPFICPHCQKTIFDLTSSLPQSDNINYDLLDVSSLNMMIAHNQKSRKEPSNFDKPRIKFMEGVIERYRVDLSALSSNLAQMTKTLDRCMQIKGEYEELIMRLYHQDADIQAKVMTAMQEIDKRRSKKLIQQDSEPQTKVMAKAIKELDKCKRP